MKIAILFFIPAMLSGVGNSIYSQSILEQYFGGNREIMIMEAEKLIHIPQPPFKSPISSNPVEKQGIAPVPETIADMGFEQLYQSESRYFTVRDSKKIHANRFASQSENTILLIHGVGSNAFMYNQTAGLLQEATGAEVYAIDLRGHGLSDGNPGDVDYINQYADDLADIATVVRKEKPFGKIIISGHSMGGGVALRFAMEKKCATADGFLLFAPLIGHNSPAFKQDQTTANTETEPFMKIHIERIIGLTMLNEIGIHDYDSLPVLFFNLPETVPLRKYSYRANKSMAPDDYVAGLNSVHQPMLILIAAKDEGFLAEPLKNAILKNSSAAIRIIDEATHNGLRHEPASFVYIKNWFSKL